MAQASIGRVLHCPAVWALMTTWFAGNWTGYVRALPPSLVMCSASLVICKGIALPFL